MHCFIEVKDIVTFIHAIVTFYMLKSQDTFLY